MGDVGVVAGVLDDRGHGRVTGQLPLGQREGGAAAARQADGDRIGEAQPGERAECRLDGGRGAGTGRPAAAQLTLGCLGRHWRLPAAGRAHRAWAMRSMLITARPYHPRRAEAAS